MERAVFILREVLEYNYTAIAEIVGRNEANCRKIFSRVKDKFPLEDVESSHMEKGKEEIIHTIASAIHGGNVLQLEKWLSDDITLYSDGGGKMNSALKPIRSRKIVLRFITYLLGQMNEEPSSMKLINVNGQTGILVIEPNNLKTVVSFNIVNQQIKEIYMMRNQDKLKHIS